jgi:hypothetical protein
MPPLFARLGDPYVATVARAIHIMFPRCLRCGRIVERYEDADVLVLRGRVVHRGRCGEVGTAHPTDETDRTDTPSAKGYQSPP